MHWMLSGCNQRIDQRHVYTYGSFSGNCSNWLHKFKLDCIDGYEYLYVTCDDPVNFLYKTNVPMLARVATATFLRPYMVVELKVLLKSIFMI